MHNGVHMETRARSPLILVPNGLFKPGPYIGSLLGGLSACMYVILDRDSVIVPSVV